MPSEKEGNMKRILKSSVFILVCSVLVSLFLFTAEASGNTYYISQGATGTGTMQNPLGSLQQGIRKLSGTDGTLVILGEYNLSGFCEPAWQGMVTVKGADSSSVLQVTDGQGAIFYGDVTLENIGLDIGTDAHIDVVGAKLVYDPGDEVSNDRGYIHCITYGNKLVEKADYVHQSGRVSHLVAAGAYVAGTSYGVSGDANFTINGGEIRTFSIDAAGYNETHTGITVGGNFNIVQNGGVLRSITYYEQTQPIIMGALQMVFNNGVGLPDLFYPQALGGTYIICSESGGTVTPTGIAGVFNIKADDGKVAKINGNPVYDGDVTFAPGKTYVSWVDGAQDELPDNIIDSGFCGNNLRWTLSDDGTLTVSGNGAITENPWKPYRAMIKYVNLEPGITSVPDFAFSYCSLLENIRIPQGVTYIGEAAFSYCTTLDSIEIPAGVLTLGENCFFYCENLETVTLGKDVHTIGIGAFDGCENLYSILTDFSNCFYSSDSAGVLFNREGTVLVRCPEGKSGEYVIPATVRYIDRFAFYDCDGLKKITVPEGVADIESRTFAGCSSLSEINLPGSVIRIAEQAFMGCSSLETVVVPDGVETIEYNAFYNCEKLSKIEIHNSVTYIGEHVFAGCPDVRIHGSRQSVAEAYAISNGIPFLDLNVIVSGSCGESVEWMLYDTYELVISGSGAMTDFGRYDVPWSRYSGLIKAVTIDIGVTSVGDYAFHGCGNLENVIIPDTVKSVGKYAFYNCKKLPSAKIPEGAVSVGEHAFSRCETLTDVTVPDSVVSVEAYAFSGCSGLQNAVLSKNITTVEEYTFSDCIMLTKAIIPSGISVDRYAFTGCPDISVEEIIKTAPGDVTGDGKVNRMDLLRLGKHFSGWTVEIDEFGADVTGDGKVNRMDLLRLGKYFSGWEVELGK